MPDPEVPERRSADGGGNPGVSGDTALAGTGAYREGGKVATAWWSVVQEALGAIGERPPRTSGLARVPPGGFSRRGPVAG
jgi:hypothetical protein